MSGCLVVPYGLYGKSSAINSGPGPADLPYLCHNGSMHFDAFAFSALSILLVMLAIGLGTVAYFLIRWIRSLAASARGRARQGSAEAEAQTEGRGRPTNRRSLSDAVWWWKHNRKHRRRGGGGSDRGDGPDDDSDDFDDDSDDDERPGGKQEDDLAPSAITILSTIDAATMVVDEDDDIVRSSPQVYQLGLARNDSVCNEELLEAIHQVRGSGERKIFDLVTHTPDDMALPARVGAALPALPAIGGEKGPASISAEASPAALAPSDLSEEDRQLQLVARRNWLTVTVRQISAHLVLVLVQDKSQERRFARIRDDFVTNISQQLLVPAQALEKLGADLNRDIEEGKMDKAILQKDARTVTQESQHLNHLVADLLILLKAQEDLVPSPENRMEVAPLLQEAAADLKASAATKNIRIDVRCQEGLFIHADKEEMVAALEKLVDNAIRYSPFHSDVVLTSSRSPDGRSALIRVIDHGQGMDKEDQKRIFERFYRGKNQNERTADGVGLGLAIVKHVALTHHGSVGVWSAPRQGSTFTVALPLA